MRRKDGRLSWLESSETAWEMIPSLMTAIRHATWRSGAVQRLGFVGDGWQRLLVFDFPSQSLLAVGVTLAVSAIVSTIGSTIALPPVPVIEGQDGPGRSGTAGLSSASVIPKPWYQALEP